MKYKYYLRDTTSPRNLEKLSLLLFNRLFSPVSISLMMPRKSAKNVLAKGGFSELFLGSQAASGAVFNLIDDFLHAARSFFTSVS
jgi:hypothetical protein